MNVLRLVLVVDREQPELDRHATLEAHGLQVITAATLESAERLYLDHRRELSGVILGGRMPDIPHTTVRLIKLMMENRRAGLFRGFMVAASSSPLLRQKMKGAGCDVEAPKEKAAELLIQLMASA